MIDIVFSLVILNVFIFSILVKNNKQWLQNTKFLNDGKNPMHSVH